MPYYYLPPPPYVLLAAGLFVGITCGLSFQAGLKQLAKLWSTDRQGSMVSYLNTPQLLLPFWGIHIGICIFLASGLQIFGFPASFSCAIALFLTIGSAGLVWYQLERILIQIEEGGSQALDLDSFG